MGKGEVMIALTGLKTFLDICFTPEQFTVKAHPALFEGVGGRERGKKK